MLYKNFIVHLPGIYKILLIKYSIYLKTNHLIKIFFRELQRLDSMTRTPIISHLTETLSGLETIRAFKQQRRFTAAMLYKIDAHTNAFLISNCATRWLGIALVRWFFSIYCRFKKQ